MITRGKDGRLRCLINACAHRGAMLCRCETDNRLTFTCPFHGWTCWNDGQLLKVKDADGAGYPVSFDKGGSHDFTEAAWFDSYRGFLFGNLNADVLPLREHLGDTSKITDMLVDQSPEGLEVLRGSSTYTSDGNGKVQDRPLWSRMNELEEQLVKGSQDLCLYPRIYSTPGAWRLRTTRRSSAPASSPSARPRRPGTT